MERILNEVKKQHTNIRSQAYTSDTHCTREQTNALRAPRKKEKETGEKNVKENDKPKIQKKNLTKGGIRIHKMKSGAKR